MTTTDQLDHRHNVSAWQSLLHKLSRELQTTPREQRPAILLRMWELSGQIAAARQRSVAR